ncbi:MAG TPA: hypothetical protein H9881_13860 [Candidatus Stackebrandtia excrementipullorum]|nr:hypothetical protein [Candidatus Stackebrandtia excrementipullorum]
MSLPARRRVSRRFRYAAAVTAACALVAGSGLAFADDVAPQQNSTLCGASFLVEPEYGDSTYQDAFDRLNGRYGLESVRVFYSGLPADWPGRIDADGLTLTVSFKADPTEILAGKHDAHLKRWFADAPTDRDIYWSYYHEPEDNIEDGHFSADDYRQAWKHLVTLADPADNPRLSATLILMGWTLENGSGRDWNDYFPGTDTIDVLAWDTYNDIHADPDTYRDPEDLFGKSVQISRDTGLPFAVAETGSDLVPGDDGTERAAWLTEVATYLTDNDALWVQYFDIDFTDHGFTDFRIRDEAGQDAWAAFCAA